MKGVFRVPPEQVPPLLISLEEKMMEQQVLMGAKVTRLSPSIFSKWTCRARAPV